MMNPTIEDVILTFVKWAEGKSRYDVIKLASALIYHHYKKNEIYESEDLISDDQGCIAITVKMEKPKTKLKLVKNEDNKKC